MIAELGQINLIIAMIFSLLLGSIPLIGVFTNKPELQRTAIPYTRGLFFFLALAFFCLVYAFAKDDFSVLYVATNSSKELPLIYKLCAVWGGHEGSMLLWVMILSVWMFAVSFSRKPLSDVMLARVLTVLAWISTGFIIFILTTSNPYLRLLDQIPSNGRDLNPLLQDPGFLFHPPMLYMGYVGFSVAFAFAIAALWAGDIKSEWAQWTKPWTTAAWCCLTTGITLGSWWAYRELGWGGWWFWDPVENASFMPWIVGTALIHSLNVTAKRGALATWTVLLAISAFCLSLIGTFLVRSGVLTSVHAFAVDPARGLYMLGFLFCVISFSLILFALRSTRLSTHTHYRLLSKESFLTINNLLLTVTMLTVLLGTLYPLIIDGLGLGKLSVGAPYFNAVFIPLFIPVLFLMGIGPHVRWGSDTWLQLLRKMYPVAIGACILALCTQCILSFAFKLNALLSWCLFYWIVLSNGFYLLKKLREKRRVTPGLLAMVIAHMGLACTVLGVAMSTIYGQERFVKMQPKSSISIEGIDIRFESQHRLKGPNYQGVEALFIIRQGKKIKTIYPQKRKYSVQQTVMTDSAIDVTAFRDVYIALGEPMTQGAWSVRIYYKPFIRWIWGGGFMILLGGLFAITPYGMKPNKARLTQRAKCTS